MSKKVNKNKPKRRALPIVLTIVIVALIAGGVAWGIHENNNRQAAKVATADSKPRPVNSIAYTPSQPSDNVANNQRKGSSTGTNPSTSGLSTQTLNSSNTAPPFSVTISRANVSGQSISVAANVNGVTSGTCTFNFSQIKNGQPTVSSPTEQIEASNQSALCPPTTVQMPSQGNWYVSVSVNNSSNTATAQWANNPVSL